MNPAGREQQFSLVPLAAENLDRLSMTLSSMDPWLTLGYTLESFEHYLKHPDPALSRYTVMISRQVAGVLSIRSPWLFGPFIELFALFEGFQGKGIGSRIIDRVCAIHQSANLWATVSSFNLRAQKFYKNKGFEQKAVLEDLIKPGWNEILLRKKVNAADRLS